MLGCVSFDCVIINYLVLVLILNYYFLMFRIGVFWGFGVFGVFSRGVKLGGFWGVAFRGFCCFRGRNCADRG